MPPEKRAAKAAQRSPRATALVVEEIPRIGTVLRNLLRGLGCECRVAAWGSAGVDEACRGDYDFVFMDLEMRTVDGCEATRRIHRELGPRSPFIVAMSGQPGREALQRCAEAGMDYFLPKPVRLQALATLVQA